MDYLEFESPIGTMTIICDKGFLHEIRFGKANTTGYSEGISDLCKNVETQLKEYFTGKRKTFDVEKSLDVTDFQRTVLNELVKIPYGKTVSYSQIAKNIGKPRAARAVGAACRINPIPVIIPCHRVVGTDDSLTGYAGGLDKKEYLIELEKKHKSD